MKKDLLSIAGLARKELLDIIELSDKVKKYPSKYSTKLDGKTLLMMFEKPSLRTRLSFETGMTQLGGHAIYYDLSTSPLGKSKESVYDTAKTASRYVDIIMARLFSHSMLEELAQHSSVPVINALTDYSHPCQIIGDLQTIRERRGRLEGLKLAYFGDGNNNVTHSLLFGCSLLGMNISVACPKGDAFEPQKAVLDKVRHFSAKSGAIIEVTNDSKKAAKDADIIYTDSWMSYHIPENLKQERMNIFMPFQVNKELMKLAKKNVMFLHCLPATRGMEMTADIIDGPQSAVFDEAENRLHCQKAVMLRLMGKD